MLAKRVLGFKKIKVKVRMKNKKHALDIAHKTNLPRKIFFDSKELLFCYFHVINTLDLERIGGTSCVVEFPSAKEYHDITVLARRPRKKWCYYDGETLTNISFENPITPSNICTGRLGHIMPSLCFHCK